jgi:AcrR family transcriptional regulator
MVRAGGLGALSLRALARAVGVEPQSLYTYFPSKHAIYDAMFAEANAEFLDRLESGVEPDDPTEALRRRARLFVEFCTADAVRYQLLFQRVVPGFEPSQGSYDIARRVLDGTRALLARAGLEGESHLEVWTSLTSGLVAQQLANDPGGTRFVRHLDEVVDMFLSTRTP